MVKQHRKKWPWKDPGRKFTELKTMVKALREVLLDASHGFTVAGSSVPSGSGHAAANSEGDVQVEGEDHEGGIHVVVSRSGSELGFKPNF